MENNLIIENMTENYINLFETKYKNYLKLSFIELPNIYSDHKNLINNYLEIDELIIILEEKIKIYLKDIEDLKNDLSIYEEDIEEIFIETLMENIEEVYDNQILNENYEDYE